MPGKPHWLVAHGGGPTAVLNASLAGLARGAAGHGATLSAARFGMEGLLAADWVSLDGRSPAFWLQVENAPGSLIGSSRRAMAGDDFPRAIQLCLQRGVTALFLTGGNGTMRCAWRLHDAAGPDLQVIGIPKTIDNDIPGMDHTPGHGSVARFFAHAARDLGADNRALPSPVTVLETLGRDAGWVTASTALARHHPDDAPHLIYLPERPVSLEQVCGDVDGVLQQLGRCVVAVCEGQKDLDGRPFGADVLNDRDGVPRLASNLGHVLAQWIGDRLRVRARSEKPGLVGRCFALASSPTDRAESLAAGEFAAQLAADGQSGVMVALNREPGPAYRLRLEPQPIQTGLRHFPHSWIHPHGQNVTEEYAKWAHPLAGFVDDLPKL
jgi:6-phosphofructokinase 1